MLDLLLASLKLNHERVLLVKLFVPLIVEHEYLVRNALKHIFLLHQLLELLFCDIFQVVFRIHQLIDKLFVCFKFFLLLLLFLFIDRYLRHVNLHLITIAYLDLCYRWTSILSQVSILKLGFLFLFLFRDAVQLLIANSDRAT